MPSELDTRLDAIMDQLTGPGGSLALATIEQDGVSLPMIATAPPALPQYFAYFCVQHGAAEFLVCGDERLCGRLQRLQIHRLALLRISLGWIIPQA